jgi:hypothetical protein
MAKGQRRSKREANEPKADKKKILASAGPVPSAPAKPEPGKRQRVAKIEG